MVRQPQLDLNSPAVQKHVGILQVVITRMANNSRACKFWCVTLVSAVLVLVARVDEPKYALIALVPVVLFLMLDTYYLALERAFRYSYEVFIDRLHDGGLRVRDVYKVERSDIGIGLVYECLRSFSIWPFYLLVVVTTVFAWLLMYI